MGAADNPAARRSATKNSRFPDAPGSGDSPSQTQSQPTDAAASVTAWLAPDAAARLCPGATGTVRTDWGATHSVTVARVGVRADYPPTAQATDDVHLTRAVSVTVTLDSGETLPPGAPVDLTLIPCKEASHG